jgi:hypothetical protein
MTRNGKIARLPESIRHELNQRLLDGERGVTLVAWLNGLPQVQAVMREAFEGRPVTEDNLSQWRNGGYLAWEAGQRMGDNVISFMDGTAALKTAARGGLTDLMALVLTSAMIGQVLKLESMPDGVEKARTLRELRLSLLALKKSELYAHRLKIEKRKPGGQRRKNNSPEAVARRQREIKSVMGIHEGYDGLAKPSLTQPPAQEKSDQIGADRTKSD